MEDKLREGFFYNFLFDTFNAWKHAFQENGVVFGMIKFGQLINECFISVNIRNLLESFDIFHQYLFNQ